MEPQRRAKAGRASNSPCVVGCGIKADTALLKSPGPFPCLFFDCYYLIHVWSLPCFMDQASWNSWNLLSFIGHVMTSRAQLKNHTVEESPTFNTQQLILSEKNKGLYFLCLWGEERAPRLRSVTTSQWPVANDSINKPTSWNLKKM